MEQNYTKLEEIDGYLATIFNEHTSIGWVQLNSIPDQILEVRQDFMDRKVKEKPMKRRVKLAYDTLQGIDELKKSIRRFT